MVVEIAQFQIWSIVGRKDGLNRTYDPKGSGKGYEAGYQTAQRELQDLQLQSPTIARNPLSVFDRMPSRGRTQI